MRLRLPHAVRLALAIASLAITGCRGDRGGDAPRGPEPEMTAPERERGALACGHYVARLCRCAAEHEDLADACRLARAQPEALQLSLDLLDDRTIHADDRTHALTNARKVIKACIEADAKLDLERCPRDVRPVAKPPDEATPDEATPDEATPDEATPDEATPGDAPPPATRTE